MKRTYKQAYRQTPWRRQMQSLGLTLLPIVSFAVIITLYLVISAQAAEAGLQIMDLHYQEEEILRTIANQRTELGWITSYTKMHQRSKKMGLSKVEPESIRYMEIKGYQQQNIALIAPPPGIEAADSPILNEFYNISLSEWLVSTFFTANQTGVEYTND